MITVRMYAGAGRWRVHHVYTKAEADAVGVTYVGIDDPAVREGDWTLTPDGMVLQVLTVKQVRTLRTVLTSIRLTHARNRWCVRRWPDFHAYTASPTMLRVVGDTLPDAQHWYHHRREIVQALLNPMVGNYDIGRAFLAAMGHPITSSARWYFLHDGEVLDMMRAELKLWLKDHNLGEDRVAQLFETAIQQCTEAHDRKILVDLIEKLCDLNGIAPERAPVPVLSPVNQFLFTTPQEVTALPAPPAAVKALPAPADRPREVCGSTAGAQDSSLAGAEAHGNGWD